MSFKFVPWDLMSGFGNGTGIADAFTEVQNELAGYEVWRNLIGGAILTFLVVDVRRRTYGPLTSPDELQYYSDQLLGLLDPGVELPKVHGECRILFVGNDALTKWEDEEQLPTEVGGLRSVKSDFEFMIRTLQSYELAHYVYIGGRDAKSDARNDFEQENGLIKSALLSFARRHSSRSNRAKLGGSEDQTKFLRGLTTLKKDVGRLLDAVRKSPLFRTLGKEEEPVEFKDKTHIDWLLNEMRLLFQLGKRNRKSAWNAPKALEQARREGKITHLMDMPDTSYEIGKNLDSFLVGWATDYKYEKGSYTGIGPFAEKLAAATHKLRRYELLRDMGRVLGSGAIPLLVHTKRTKRILIIDDDYYFYGDAEGLLPPEDSWKRLKNMLQMIGWDQEVFVVPSAFVSCSQDPLTGDHYNQLFNVEMKPRSVFVETLKLKSTRPEYFDVIIIDPESTSDQYGPERVARLANYLKVVTRDPAPSNSRLAKTKINSVPRIIAFSQRESSGHVQQCLNLGAWAFVHKNRVFQLAFEMTRAVKSNNKLHRNETGRASHFAILDALKPHAALELQRAEGALYVHGGLYLEGEKPIQDEREEKWLQDLPKADLHYHIGTAIPLHTVRQLALNTVGYWRMSESFNPEKANEFWAPSRERSPSPVKSGGETLIRRVAECVVLAKQLYSLLDAATTGLSPMVLLAAATAGVLKLPKLDVVQFGLGDRIVGALSTTNDRVIEFQVAALLVSFLAKGPTTDESKKDVQAVLNYFDKLANFTKVQKRSDSVGEVGFQPQRGLATALERTRLQLNQIAGRWDNYYTSGTIQRCFRSDKKSAVAFWRHLNKSFRKRQDVASEAISSAEQDAVKNWLTSVNHINEVESARKLALELLISERVVSEQAVKSVEARVGTGKWSLDHCGLEGYVCIPDVQEENERQTYLQLYLRGADLLGSAHLQYPDNLLLAAFAITRDNVKHNVIYSEIRCETPGYTRGGMGSQDATDTLLRGFDIAALFLTTQERNRNGCDDSQNWPLVRTNVLLAGKRHKTPEEARKVIALLEGYLERQSGEADLGVDRSWYKDAFPRWWRPAEVVGFDISGDESKPSKWPVEMLQPLTMLSSNITIHAGEAASAQSIWEAVYRLNATRIGHGLRLAEDVALLGYCVREGICMEMCPNSNKFTNRFAYSPVGGASESLLPQYRYPLLDYMSRGLEVTIATDNRYLHPVGNRTLTSEYVAAVRLVGGMTQWEVLQIVKAGFKNAFLSKHEIGEMLGAVEERLYAIIASAS